jgi:putative peptidoglycan lipid II flippase
VTENKKKFYLATLIVAISNLLSRILGLLRSTILAAIYGATENNGIADCYNASFVLPDIIYNLTVFGIVSIVLVPFFSGILADQDVSVNKNEELDKNCCAMINFFFAAIAALCLLAWFFAPAIVKNFLVKGFASDIYKIETTIRLTRIMLLQPLFVTLAGILGAYMNARERYTSYSIAMLFYNIGIITGILLLHKRFGIDAAAWGTVIGSFLWFAIQLAGAVSAGFRYTYSFPKFDKEFFSLIFLAVPRVIALGGEQFVKFFITGYASFLCAGALTIYSYAENFSMVPYGMIAVSLSTTAFPIFSKNFALAEYDKMLESLFDKLKILLFLALPICSLMIILRLEMIDLLLGYKSFTQQDTLLTCNTFLSYMIGIPFFSITIVVAKYFYAQKKTFMPMFVSLLMCAVTIVSSYLLIKVLPENMKISGLSWGRTAGYFIQMILLLVMIFATRNIRYTCFPKTQIIEIVRVIFMNCIFALSMYFIHSLTFSFICDNILLHSKLQYLLSGCITGFCAILLYFLLGIIFKLPYFNAITSRFKKSGRTK